MRNRSTPDNRALRVALGVRAHSGWAALVAVGQSGESFEVIDRRRLELGDPATPGPKQPYHEAEGKPMPEAAAIVERHAREARRRALASLGGLCGEWRSKGYAIAGCGLLIASNRTLPPLESILASHALIHAADGELFRDALAHAAQECDMKVLRTREREVLEKTAALRRVKSSEIERWVAELGRGLGAPWTQDQKLAAAAASLVLGARSPRPPTKVSA